MTYTDIKQVRGNKNQPVHIKLKFDLITIQWLYRENILWLSAVRITRTESLWYEKRST